MLDDAALVISAVPLSARRAPGVEICEHKGIGHPDSICDGVAEAVSRALSLEYLRTFGQVQHHNVDKALLIGGQSTPRFGGGELSVKPRLIVCGRATRIPGVGMAECVGEAARRYLQGALHCDPSFFRIESAVHDGSANLQQVFRRSKAKPLANDTSFGCGHFPYSDLEGAVLTLGRILGSPDFKASFSAAGDDYKIMGHRIGEKMSFTIALAFIDREIHNVAEYFRMKDTVVSHVQSTIGRSSEVLVNMLDDPQATDESGIYLTVTGLSAEHGDDGQVGRGNRVNGLITPGRVMSLEAAAGKNPVAHVGKIYNVLALEMAQAIVKQVQDITEASVQILSRIGQPVAEPQVVAVEVATCREMDARDRAAIKEVARSCLEHVDEISQRLIRGIVPVF